ncbi:MAG: hypothetical protein COW00_16555 [Bdellovibrio sp. CG12_big_fil_rev_8_21_14_0_65_39_13]|nr:MAG: hypothetical protein COW78_09845 [Bdellovibrio sp. CG22_combo_CG10-13_8_21_14_all_39_27]PIQ58219.1 MAG: hypothetical protein COW00_16555 [Bdellovibrio sp. CG12_big_fil_rev_8_21_14_0_65_39_13]PIR36628.1 MAG: hypothetical protein COV37_02075 [Bdellovibrio sp. CG11_big_fil_rev_8_21_14_0_20_39_38]
MFSLKKVLNPLKKLAPQNTLMGYFISKQESEESSYQLALQSYQELRKQCKTQEEFMLFLLEDIIFTSLSATFYEEVFNTAKENPSLAHALIDEFEKDTDSREQNIAELTEFHARYIMNNGKCPGCPACSNHSDVHELLVYWKQNDMQFFSRLYIGMQTIKFAMEDLLYMGLIERPELIQKIDRTAILNFRQDIIDWVEAQKEMN